MPVRFNPQAKPQPQTHSFTSPKKQGFLERILNVLHKGFLLKTKSCDDLCAKKVSKIPVDTQKATEVYQSCIKNCDFEKYWSHLRRHN